MHAFFEVIFDGTFNQLGIQDHPAGQFEDPNIDAALSLTRLNTLGRTPLDIAVDAGWAGPPGHVRLLALIEREQDLQSFWILGREQREEAIALRQHLKSNQDNKKIQNTTSKRIARL